MASTTAANADPPKPRRQASIRAARVEDAAGVWALVRDSGVLDLNSPYAYLLGFRHHGSTSVVAVDDTLPGSPVVGFVLAYRPGDDPETVFVWQVGVASSHRRTGLGRRLLHAVLDRDVCRGVRFLEATVTPSNEPSLGLFAAVARDRGAEFEVSPCFTADHFPSGTDHEPEDLVRIGPLAGAPARSP